MGLLTSLGLAVPAAGGVGCGTAISNPVPMGMDSGVRDTGSPLDTAVGTENPAPDAGSPPDTTFFENPAPPFDTGPLDLPDVPPDGPDGGDDPDGSVVNDASADDAGSDGDGGAAG